MRISDWSSDVCSSDLTAFRRGRAFAEDFEDQPGPVDDLAPEPFLKIALLNRGKRTIDDDQLRLIQLASNTDVLDLAFAEQRAGARFTDRNRNSIGHHEADGQRKALDRKSTRLNSSH